MQQPTFIKQLVRFNLVGVLNTAVDFCLFFLLTQAGLPYLMAQVCSYSAGIANSYICNKYWTFRVAGVRGGEMVKFATVNAAALLLSLLLVYCVHSLLHFSLLPAKIAATVFTMLISFFGNRLWVFKPTAGTTDP